MIVRRLSDDEVYHYGIKGMRWGVRRYQNSDGSLTAEGKARQKIKERKESLRHTATLSDEQLKKAINRMQLEKQYKNMTKENIKDSNTKIKDALKTVGKISISAVSLGIGAYAVSSISKQNKVVKSAKTLSNNLSPNDLQKEINVLKNKQEYVKLYKDMNSAGNNFLVSILQNSGKSVIGAAATGLTAYGLHAAISGDTDRKVAADYIAPRPNRKK